MTIHLISVGKSILDNLERVGEVVTEPAVLDRIRAANPRWLFHAAGVFGDPDVEPAAAAKAWLDAALNLSRSPEADQLKTAAGRALPQLWPAKISAELHTFDRMRNVRRLKQGDLVVLILSDTVDGLLAGLWNGLALADGHIDRVRFHDDPAEEWPLSRGVVLALIPGLDAGTRVGFMCAMRGLGLVGRALLDRVARQGEAFCVHLSGGYKATVPYLIGLAEGLRSLPEAGTVTAYVLHETTDNPIELPLRRLPAQAVRDELAWLGKEAVKNRPAVAGFLEGYAYERTDDGWTLSPYGAGLKALYGDNEPDLMP